MFYLVCFAVGPCVVSPDTFPFVLQAEKEEQVAKELAPPPKAEVSEFSQPAEVWGNEPAAAPEPVSHSWAEDVPVAAAPVAAAVAAAPAFPASDDWASQVMRLADNLVSHRL